jgi:DNA-binding LacI/PurR family transcriptional regulator
VHIAELGRRALELLHQTTDPGAEELAAPTSITLEPAPVVRQSCGAAPPSLG